MKEGALAGKRSVANPCLPSVKEGGIEGREGILGGSLGQKIARNRIALTFSNKFINFHEGWPGRFWEGEKKNR